MLKHNIQKQREKKAKETEGLIYFVKATECGGEIAVLMGAHGDSGQVDK